MIQGILQAALTQVQRALGLYLVEPDDHTVELRSQSGNALAVWSSSGATIEEIRREANKHLFEEQHVLPIYTTLQ